MTADDFRRLALALPGAIESSHLRHPDFRVAKRIFATLGYPSENHGMVKLTPEQQQIWMRKAPRVFSPASGAWGAAGSTVVLLTAATKPLVSPALKVAWQHTLDQGKKRARAKLQLGTNAASRPSLLGAAKGKIILRGDLTEPTLPGETQRGAPART